ncbi:MAG: hypothetical protein KBS81_08320 [Spirochaetales bacterium]|nr:hypothetical protein [Candidatus Physcosoma equi]
MKTALKELQQSEKDKLRDAFIQKQTLFDDRFLRLCVEQFPDIVELVIQVVTESETPIVEILPQMNITRLMEKSVTIDAVAIDEDGKCYALEVQKRKKGASVLRARYINALCLIWRTPKGVEADETDAYCTLIFVTADDFLENDLPLTTMSLYENETGKPVDDHTKVIFVNGAKTDDTSLGRLMQDFHQTDYRKAHYPIIREALKYFKETEKGKEKVMSKEEYIEDVMELMHDTIEEIAEERAKEIAEERAKEMAKDENRRSRLEDLKTIKSHLKLTTEATLDWLKIDDEEDRAYYAKALENAGTCA